MSNKRERTREHILVKSYELFADKGFNRVTMKDICEATGLSRGGLYSHFSGTREVFEAILQELNRKKEMDFEKEMQEGVSAIRILQGALTLLEEEMQHAEDSLSLAMYEYADSERNGSMEYFHQIGEKKWTQLIEYGIARGEFHDVVVQEIVQVILYAYQGVRMWSRIVSVTPEKCKLITAHIRKQLIKEEKI